jgi:hypothetical protein
VVGVIHYAGECICEQLSEDQLRPVESMIANGAPSRAIAGRYLWTKRDIRMHAKQCMSKKQEQKG